MGKVFGSGIIGIAISPGIGQVTAGINSAIQHRRHSMATHHAGLRNNQQRANIGELVHEGQIYNAACIDNHNDAPIGCAGIPQHIMLIFAQEIIARAAEPIRPLACHAADHTHGYIGIRSGHTLACRRIKGRSRIGKEEAVHALHLSCLLVNHIAPCNTRRLIAFLIVPEPFLCRQLKACSAQPFGNGHAMPLIHIAGASAALYGVLRARAIQRKATACLQRQDTVILQQDDTLFCSLLSHAHMRFFPGLELRGGCSTQRAGTNCSLHCHPPLD